MSTIEAVKDETTTAEIEELRARLAALEQNDPRTNRLLGLPVAPKPQGDFAQGKTAQQERARLERVKVAEAAAEATRLQAIKNAPKRAKRDAEIVALDARYVEACAEVARAEQAAYKLGAELNRLRSAAL